MPGKDTVCPWYDGTALEAAQFYAWTFPGGAVGTVLRAPGDDCAGREGDVLKAALADPDRAAATRAFEAMMQMGKIDIAAIEAARRG